VWQLVLSDGSVVVGQEMGWENAPSVDGDEGRRRVRMKVGNRELSGQDFRWINGDAIVQRTRPVDMVRVIRSEYGDAFGRIVAAQTADGAAVEVGSGEALASLLEVAAEQRREKRRLEDRLERIRQPLTQVEEALDIVERSTLAGSAESRREAEHLAQEIDQLAAELSPALATVERELATIRSELDAASLNLVAGEQTLELPLANVVEVVWINRMGTLARLWWATRECGRFLISEPREANTEGGIFPALFGTVLLVLLMSVAVMPLGVITAVYMTEYATDGILLRLANQAVNNLAGVPSIVFGMFGLAFFIYGVGGSLDRIFYPERLPTPTFGTGGVLWASLTLALLTVPVVVVATRESLLAVPRAWREGSLALGATRWQTLRRITLPAAMPGILTGLILAVGRAAGEVAPLMLTGAVKLAPSLPVDGSVPFLHLQRKFMHLGFHIYDVSMQSPNVEAAKPMAFATTLVLLALVVAMNLAAIVVRRRLRRAYAGQAV
jgi:phosphate transport system permease protein